VRPAKPRCWPHLLGAVAGALGNAGARLHPDRVDADARAASAGHLLQPLDRVRAGVFDRVGGAAVLAGEAQPLGEAVDRNHPLGAHQVDRSAAKYPVGGRNQAGAGEAVEDAVEPRSDRWSHR